MAKISVDTDALLAGADRIRPLQREASRRASDVDAVRRGLTMDIKARQHLDRRFNALRAELLDQSNELADHISCLAQSASRYRAADTSVVRAVPTGKPTAVNAAAGAFCAVEAPNAIPASLGQLFRDFEDDVLLAAGAWLVNGDPKLGDSMAHFLDALKGLLGEKYWNPLEWPEKAAAVDEIIWRLEAGDYLGAMWVGKDLIPVVGEVFDIGEAYYHLGEFLGETWPPSEEFIALVDGVGDVATGIGQGFVEGLDVIGDAAADAWGSFTTGIGEMIQF